MIEGLGSLAFDTVILFRKTRVDRFWARRLEWKGIRKYEWDLLLGWKDLKDPFKVSDWKRKKEYSQRF